MPRSEHGKAWLERDDHTIYFEGYATVAASDRGVGWVCRPCFDDFAHELDFEVVDGTPDAEWH